VQKNKKKSPPKKKTPQILGRTSVTVHGGTREVPRGGQKEMKKRQTAGKRPEKFDTRSPGNHMERPKVGGEITKTILFKENGDNRQAEKKQRTVPKREWVCE